MYTLYIVNKAGSLLFHTDFARPDAAKMNANEKIMLASMFHRFVQTITSKHDHLLSVPTLNRLFWSLSAIAGKLSPAADRSGMQVMEADTFRLQSYRAPTGVHVLSHLVQL